MGKGTEGFGSRMQGVVLGTGYLRHSLYLPGAGFGVKCKTSVDMMKVILLHEPAAYVSSKCIVFAPTATRWCWEEERPQRLDRQDRQPCSAGMEPPWLFFFGTAPPAHFLGQENAGRSASRVK